MPINSLGMKLAKRIGMRKAKAPSRETPRLLLHCIRLDGKSAKRPDPSCQLASRAAELTLSCRNVL
jgi:hypothetical protein